MSRAQPRVRVFNHRAGDASKEDRMVVAHKAGRALAGYAIHPVQVMNAEEKYKTPEEREAFRAGFTQERKRKTAKDSSAPYVRVINHVAKDVVSLRQIEAWQQKRKQINSTLTEIQAAAGNLVTSVAHIGQLEPLRNDNFKLKAAVDKLFYLIPA